MHPIETHPWNLTPQEAMALQTRLAARVLQTPLLAPPRLVAGIDAGYRDGLAHAVVVTLALPELTTVEVVTATLPITFPYVPGLLSFREGPAVLAALAQLTQRPDLLMFDAQGLAHPRRLGLASHIGVLLDCPSIGCAKQILCGEAAEPGEERGAQTELCDGDEVIGAVVRTRSRTRPLIVSVGHRITLAEAVECVLRCGGGYRLPEPTRRADQLTRQKERPHL